MVTVLSTALKVIGVTALAASTCALLTAATIYRVYGLPFDPTQPPWYSLRRIGKLNLAALHELASLRYLIPYLKIRYYLAHPPKEGVQLGVAFGSPFGSFVDVYTPPSSVPAPSQAQSPSSLSPSSSSLSSSFVDVDAELDTLQSLPPSPSSSLSSSPSTSSTSSPALPTHTLPARRFPVVVFVHGGAWAYGSSRFYPLLADELRHRGYVVLVPNYVKHPHGDIQDMVLDIQTCLAWLEQNGASFGADLDAGVALMGHSAGAHIATLLVVRDALQLSKDFSAPLPGYKPPAPNSTSFGSSPSRLVKAVVALSGVYDVADHYLHEAQRGVECVSPMWHVMGRCKGNFAFVSPAGLLSIAHSTSRIIPKPPVRFLLLHGSRDTTVPVSSSEKFHTALRRCGFASSLRIYAEAGHADLVMELMQPASVSPAKGPALRNTAGWHGRRFGNAFGDALIMDIESFLFQTLGGSSSAAATDNL